MIPTRETVRRDANRQQGLATLPTASVWVGASAGTGKTTVLVNRLLRLLLEGSAPHRILCLTYTKAAAAEMANRLAVRLSNWATQPDAELEEDLVRLLDTAPNAAQLSMARTLFATVLDTPGGMHIETIHAFCQSVLKRFPVEAEIAPHFEVLDERDGAAIRREAIREVVSRAQGANGSDLAEALAVVTGYVTEDDFGALIDQLLSARFRLFAGLRDLDAPSLARQIEKVLGIPTGQSAGSVADSFCDLDTRRAADLRRVAAAMAAGKPTDQKRAAPLDFWLTLTPAARPAALDEYRKAFLNQTGEPFASFLTKGVHDAIPDGESVMAAECAALMACLKQLANHEVAAATGALLTLARETVLAYERRKRARAALDFDDLIHKVRDLLSDGAGSAAWVLYKLDGGLDHLLVDEAQDTSPEQWELLSALAEEFFAGEGGRDASDGPRTLFVVGDVKQSIYSFQGAEPSRFVAMRDFFQRRIRAAEQRFEIVDLHVAFRGTEAVLETVDKVFGDDAAADGVAIDGAAIRHEAERIGERGRVEIWPVVTPSEEPEEDPWAPPVVQPGLSPPRQRLATEIAARIDDWVRGGGDFTWYRGHPRPLGFRDIMILVRRRGDKAGFVEEIVRALKNKNVPVAGVDRMFLTEQLAVMDLVALGNFLLLPEDDLTLATVLKGPFFRLTEEDLFELAYDRGHQSLWRRLGELRARRDGFEQAHRRLSEWMARADFVPPYDLFARILEGDGGRAALLGQLGIEADDPLDEFLSLALAYERDHPRSLQGFLHWLGAAETQIKRDLEQSARDEVRVMTVHGSKGLEAPIVFLPDTRAAPQVSDRLLWPEASGGSPGLPIWAPARDLEQEEASARRATLEAKQRAEYRRLLYVAMTRAADRLIVCGWDTKRSAPKGNWYDLIVGALSTDLDPVPMSFPAGDFDGDGYIIDKGTSAQSIAPRPAPLVEPEPPEWALQLPDAEPDPPAPLAPSRPSGEEPPVRAPFDPDESNRFRRGRLIHTLLELLPELPVERRRDAARAYLARPMHELSEDEISAYVDETLGILDDPAYAALFGPGSLAEVPLTGLAGQSVVSGQVDRLLVTGDRVLVVDYKTNRPPPASAADVAPIYLRQMAAYRALLREIYPDRRVDCALLWTDAPRLMPLPEALLDVHSPVSVGEIAPA